VGESSTAEQIVSKGEWTIERDGASVIRLPGPVYAKIALCRFLKEARKGVWVLKDPGGTEIDRIDLTDDPCIRVGLPKAEDRASDPLPRQERAEYPTKAAEERARRLGS